MLVGRCAEYSTGSVGVRGSSPLSSTVSMPVEMRHIRRSAGFLCIDHDRVHYPMWTVGHVVWRKTGESGRSGTKCSGVGPHTIWVIFDSHRISGIIASLAGPLTCGTRGGQALSVHEDPRRHVVAALGGVTQSHSDT